MIESITLRGLLTFGWEPVTLPLRNLNLLIGTNGSGKTSLIDAIDVLRATPIDAAAPIRNKGGAAAWLHKGEGGGDQGSIEVVLTGSRVPLRYRLVLRLGSPGADAIVLANEALETRDNHPADHPFSFFMASPQVASFKSFNPSFPIQDELFGNHMWHSIGTGALSTLAVLRGNPLCPEITHVAQLFDQIHILQGWTIGPASLARWAQQDAGLPGRFLLDYGQNLGLVLHRLRQNGQVWQRLRELLRSPYPQLEDVETSQEDNQVKFSLRERGLGALIPPSRISDGTLRWLMLLCLLLDPQPPPLICLEEPEIGLHPDLIATLAGLLREAAERTQLILTTHSDALVSEFSDTPEDVVVCEREFGCTTLRRLERAPLAHWLEKYSLGHVWRTGALGGVRW